MPTTLKVANNNVTLTTGLRGPQGEKGDAGDKGDVGDKGDKGDPGANGAATTYSGSGAPSGGLGSDGDTYLDIVNGNTYEKSGGTWGSPTGSIKGNTGDDAPIVTYLEAEATTYVDEITASVSADKYSAINTLVQRMKAEGIWQKLDVLNIDFGISEQATLLNMIDPTQVATNNGAAYTAGSGFQGDGVADWIDSGVAFSGMSNYAQDSASVGYWSLTDTSDSGRDIGASNSANMFIISRSAGGSLQGRANDTTAISDLISSSLGMFGINRSGSTARQLYHDGVEVDNDTTASTAVPTGNLSVLKGNTVFSPRQIFAWAAGGSLTAGEWLKFYELLKDIRDGISYSPSDLVRDNYSRITPQPLSSASGTLTVDFNKGHIIDTTMTEDITTVSVGTWPSGVTQLRFFLKQDSTGGWTVTWPAAWKTEANAPAPQPATAVNSITQIVATSYDGGTTVLLSSGGVWNA